jgi:putative colanic acid biosynthesis UDP-glucose lipid carrier transferase
MEIYKAEDTIAKVPVKAARPRRRIPVHAVRPGISDWHSSFWKRSFDILLSAFLVVALLSWVYLILGILIKINSRGPVLFIQKRVGKAGKVFNCYKFRTMHVNDVSEVKPAFANDARITSPGRVLRISHLDELPQLVNILKGDMSFIGPRPHMIHDDNLFALFHPNYNLRKNVRPGLTGLAQIKGYHGFAADNYSISCRTKMDIFYISKASASLDVKILFTTLLLPLFKKY